MAQNELPILCSTCMGPNPYVKFLRFRNGKECTICKTPYTSFKWRPGKDAREKGTVLCQTCARIKNVCQTCIFDLEYNLPVQVRDQVLNVPQNDLPQSDVGKAVQKRKLENQMEVTGAMTLSAAANLPRNQILDKWARKTPNYERNRPHICTFWLNSSCNRGETCPFRHERPQKDADDPLSHQNIKDRYHGINDPVAEIMLTKMKNGEGDDEKENKSTDPQPDDRDSNVPKSSYTSLPPPKLPPPPGAKGGKRTYASQNPERYGGDLKRSRKSF